MRAWVIHNPAAGPPRADRSALDAALAVLARHGWDVTLHTAEGAGAIVELAVGAVAAQCDAVIVAGGDGSVREAAGVLASRPVALGVLPCGTANVWAQEMGLPLPGRGGGRLAEAAQRLVESEVRAVDLGRAGGRYFLLWAGVGLDAHIAAQVNPGWLKQNFGAPGYVLNALVAAARFRSIRTRLILDSGVVEGQMLLTVVANTQLYAGGVVRLDERARLDDGLLETWAFQGGHLRQAVGHLLRIWAGRHWGAPGVWQGRVRRIRIETDPATFVQLDGDPVLRTPVEIEVVPGALRVLVPREAATRLFSRPAA